MESFFYKVNETEYLVNVTKKKMKSIGHVEVPSEAFLSILKSDEIEK